MNWDDLRIYLAISRNGTLSGAARELGVNGTTVGRRLERLEAETGTLLFTRTADGLVPTPAGRGMLEHARRMERSAQVIEHGFGGRDQRLEGAVRIALTDGLATHFLLDQLGAFRHDHPGIALELNTGNKLVDLSRGEADLALRFGQPGAGVPTVGSGRIDVTATRVGTVGVSLYASRAYLQRSGHPRSGDDLTGHELIVPKAEAAYIPGTMWLEARVADNRVSLRTDSLYGQAAAARAGFGITAVPLFMAIRHADLVRITPPTLIDKREIWLMSPADLRGVARIRVVREFLTTLLREWGPVLEGQ